MEIVVNVLSVALAYLVGSIPTAVLYSKWFHRKDIRKMGDGNMGARNTSRQFGFGAGLSVAVIDIMKGLAAVWIAMLLQRTQSWQLISAAAAILGHDFPVFAGFKGGQGLAVTTGVLLCFFPVETFLGFLLYVILYLIFKNSDLAASIGFAAVVVQQLLNHASLTLVAFTILALLVVPLKKGLDRSRREKNRSKNRKFLQPRKQKQKKT